MASLATKSATNELDGLPINVQNALRDWAPEGATSIVAWLQTVTERELLRLPNIGPVGVEKVKVWLASQ